MSPAAYQKNFHPVYILSGDNHLSKSEFKEKLSSQIKKSYGSVEHIFFYASEDAPEDIINEVLSSSLFNKHKIIFVAQAEKLITKKNQEIVEFIKNYSKRKEYPSTLILITEDKKISLLGKLPGKNFKTIYESKMPSWIMTRMRSMGKQINNDAAQFIAFRCGRNLQAVSAELQKLILAYPGKKRITLDDVKGYIGTYQKNDIFGYLDAVMDLDRKKALATLDNLIEFGEEPLKIVSMLKWKLQQMITAKFLMQKGLSEKNIITKMKLKPAFLYRGMCRKLEKFSIDKLILGYEDLKETDIKLKSSGSANKKLLLEKFSLSLLTC